MIEDQIWAEEIAARIKEKMLIVANRNQHNIPYITVDGRYDDQTECNICWWTNGFWGGMMWQLYQATGEQLYRTIAEECEQKLDRNLMIHQGMDHDSGFKWLLTAVADYRTTGNDNSKNRGLLAADNLAGRYNLKGQFIRAWNDAGDGATEGWAIIDCMMNLPLLYWAYEITKDHRYLQIAMSHADTARNTFVREDGSVNHIVVFHPMTGEVEKTLGGQGYEEGSCWTRGQAWAVYGFTLSYIHTGNIRYLETARKTADYFAQHIPQDDLIPVDFMQPSDCNWKDSSAAAIAACGFLELAKQLGSGESAQYYRKQGVRLLRAIVNHSSNWSTDSDNLVERCSVAYHDKNHEFSLIYADYFFIEAIWKLTGDEQFEW